MRSRKQNQDKLPSAKELHPRSSTHSHGHRNTVKQTQQSTESSPSSHKRGERNLREEVLHQMQYRSTPEVKTLYLLPTMYSSVRPPLSMDRYMHRRKEQVFLSVLSSALDDLDGFSHSQRSQSTTTHSALHKCHRVCWNSAHTSHHST